MSSLKDIKNRIQGIQSTKKITRAMKMVAAAKVKRTESAVKASRPFTFELNSMFTELVNSIGNNYVTDLKIKNPIDNFPCLLKIRPVDEVGLLVFTSNRGLAGSYNVNVVRKTLQLVKEYSEKGIKSKLFVVGQKGISSLTKKCANYNCEIVKTYCDVMNNPTVKNVSKITSDIAAYFVEEKIDRIEIVTTRFKNMMSYFVENWIILPVPRPEGTSKVNPVIQFEPSIEVVLQSVVPLYISNIIYQAVLEAQASELASRMTAMSAATNSAEQMLSELSVQYNKTRQYAITNEIIEVVSGANAQN